MELEWNKNKVLDLIRHYQTNSGLWDRTDINYKDKARKNKIWQNIALAMDMPKGEIENKIHTLRSQFARERKRILEGSQIESKWMYYDALKFLLGDASEQLEESPLIIDIKTEPTSPQIQRERKRTRDSSEELDIVRTKRIIMDEPNQKPEKDEFDIYAQYVASELRAAKTEKAALQAKYCINNILIDMRMGTLGETFHRDRKKRRVRPAPSSFDSETNVLSD